jgi:MSHA pilin protein MshD
MKWGQTPFASKRGRTSPASQRGVTLIELVVSIVVIATAGSALLGTLSYLAGEGSDYLQQAQAQSIADSYLAEITGKSFADPGGGDGEPRLLFDDVDDYNGLSEPATNAAGAAPGNYQVQVALTAGGLGALPANAVWRIDVTVSYDNGSRSLVATGYRTNHP